MGKKQGVVYSASKNSCGFGGVGGKPLRSRICVIISACICSGTGDQRLNCVAQNALPCVDERSSSAIPKDSDTGISALTMTISSSLVMSKIFPRRFCTRAITGLTKLFGTLHSKAVSRLLRQNRTVHRLSETRLHVI